MRVAMGMVVVLLAGVSTAAAAPYEFHPPPGWVVVGPDTVGPMADSARQLAQAMPAKPEMIAYDPTTNTSMVAVLMDDVGTVDEAAIREAAEGLVAGNEKAGYSAQLIQAAPFKFGEIRAGRAMISVANGPGPERATQFLYIMEGGSKTIVMLFTVSADLGNQYVALFDASAGSTIGMQATGGASGGPSGAKGNRRTGVIALIVAGIMVVVVFAWHSRSRN